MKLLDFFIDWHKSEEERKTSLENSLNIPIGILTVIFAVLFYLISEFDFKYSSQVEIIIFLFSSILSFLFSLFSCYFLFKSYNNLFKGYEYMGLPFPTQLFRHNEKLDAYYKQYQANFPDKSGDTEFEKYLTEKIANHLDTNTYNNDLKAKYLYISKRYLFISVLVLVISFIPFLTNLFNKPEKTYQVEFKNDVINLPNATNF